MTDKSFCLKVVSKWIKTALREKKKQFFALQDFILDDLEYTHKASEMLKMTEFLESLDQKDEEVIVVRRYVNL